MKLNEVTRLDYKLAELALDIKFYVLSSGIEMINCRYMNYIVVGCYPSNKNNDIYQEINQIQLWLAEENKVKVSYTRRVV